ncbi:MAG: phospholipase D-like domain-containing protein [Candidatus Omnitrophica bacterium]|nr:phospholipase D-like domain-containing protein [Candidatus Omnitrophota bacterium]
MKNKFILGLFLCCWLIAAPVIAGQEGFHPAEVKNISDRAYEKAVIQVLDNAQESIVISMYILKPDVSAKYPINRLMQDLEEALDRGVEVTIFINSKRDQSSGFFDSEFLSGNRQNAKFIVLIKAYLAAEGKDINDFTQVDLAKMFYVNRSTIIDGLR